MDRSQGTTDMFCQLLGYWSLVKNPPVQSDASHMLHDAEWTLKYTYVAFSVVYSWYRGLSLQSCENIAVHQRSVAITTVDSENILSS